MGRERKKKLPRQEQALRREKAKEKQLKEEEKILESVAEGRGMAVARAEKR